MSCFPFIRSGQNHLARHSERGKKTRKTKEEVGRQHQGMDRPGVRQVSEDSFEQGKMEKTGCKIICSAPATLAVKGLMMMMKINGVLYIRSHKSSLMKSVSKFKITPMGQLKAKNLIPKCFNLFCLLDKICFETASSFNSEDG